ncbi:MFS transporter [bacterium]|nr:MFS transporter [bacterium]
MNAPASIAPASPFENRSALFPAVLMGSFSVITAASNFYLAVFFEEQLGFSGLQIGVLFALQAVTGMLTAFPAGFGNDRVTSRTLVGIALLMQAAGFWMMSAVVTFPVFIGAFFVWAFSHFLFKTSLDVHVLKTGERATSGTRLGLYLIGRFIGLAFGTVAAGYIIDALDFVPTLWITAGLCLLLALSARLLAPTPLSAAPVKQYMKDFSDPRALLFAGWLFLFTTHWGAEFTCYGLFLRKSLGLTYGQMGWYMTAEFVAIVVVLVAFRHRMNEGLPLKGLAVAGLCMSGFGHIGMVFGGTVFSVAARTVHGFGDGIMMLIMYVGVARLFRVERMGGNAGLVQLALMSGNVVGALVFGPMGSRMGYGVPFVVSGIVIVALALPLVLPMPQKWRRDTVALPAEPSPAVEIAQP